MDNELEIEIRSKRRACIDGCIASGDLTDGGSARGEAVGDERIIG